MMLILSKIAALITIQFLFFPPENGNGFILFAAFIKCDYSSCVCNFFIISFHE